MTLMLVQMHGLPGSGKTTLARALGRVLPAIVIDKDVIGSALLEAGFGREMVGHAAYECMNALAARALEDGTTVIMDSPCFWPAIEANTRRIAARAGAEWRMVETRCPGDELDRRLATRERLATNPAGREPRREGMYDVCCERLIVDTRQPIDDMVGAALRYLRNVAVPV